MCIYLHHLPFVFQINELIAIPAMANSFAFDPIVDKYDLSSLKLFIFVAAPTSEEVLRKMKKRLNVPYIRGGKWPQILLCNLCYIPLYDHTNNMSFNWFQHMEWQRPCHSLTWQKLGIQSISLKKDVVDPYCLTPFAR